MAKQMRFTLRTTEEFDARLKKAAERLGLDQSVLATAAIEAVINHVEEFGELTIPVRLAHGTKKEGTGRSAIIASEPAPAAPSRLIVPPEETPRLNEPGETQAPITRNRAALRSMSAKEKTR